MKPTRAWLWAPTLAVCWACASVQPPEPRDAALNAAGLHSLPIDLFGRPEAGWAVYAPRVARTLATSAALDTPAFAAAVARWRRAHGLPGAGEVDATLLQARSTRPCCRR